METSFAFLLAIIAAYASACFIWLGVYKLYPLWWPVEIIEKPERSYKDLLIALGAAVAIMGIGQLYSAGLLLPEGNNRYWASASWVLNNLIIFSPIFITLWFRKQSLNTVFLSVRKLGFKLGFGVLVSLVGLLVFYLVSDGENRLTAVLGGVVQLENLRNFPAVFLEGVAIAFLFVRLSWTFGKKWAIAIPALLFALAHIPRSIAENETIPEMLAYSVVTASVTALILHTSHKSRDVIWLGVIHYVMDIAIGAFN